MILIEIWPEKQSGSVRFASWPAVSDPEESILNQWNYLTELAHSTRARRDYYMKPKAKKGEQPVSVPAPVLLTISVAKEFPAWKKKTLDIVSGIYSKAENGAAADEKEILKILNTQADLKKDIKKIMPFAADLKVRIYVIFIQFILIFPSLFTDKIISIIKQMNRTIHENHHDNINK